LKLIRLIKMCLDAAIMRPI